MKIRKRRLINIKNKIISYLLQALNSLDNLQQCKPSIKVCIGLSLVLLVTLWKIWPSDVCGGKKILKALCNEYYKREISGDICYTLCEEKMYDLTRCIENGKYIKTFLVKDNLLVRAPVSILHPQLDSTLPIGLTLEAFINQTSEYLSNKLGHIINQDLVNRVLQFADFNENQELSLGEVQSMWRLINNQEFLLLFLFHKQSSIPNINGTCGGLYRYQYRTKRTLYQADKSGFLSSIFKKSYRWGFPMWSDRIKVAVGLLELVIDLSETEGISFYLCNISPSFLGHTDKFELVLNDLSDLKSSKMLKDGLENRTCSRNVDCRYTEQCETLCDLNTHSCTDKVTRPTLWYICDIIREYLLVDATGHFYYDLKRYVEKCSQMHPNNLEFSAYINDFHSFLWDFIKYNKK